MFTRIRISKDYLIVSKMPFGFKRSIDLNTIRSIEIYGKSVIPPLVFSIFLITTQLILFSLGKIFLTIQDMSFFFLINFPIMICLIVAIMRSKYSTIRITNDQNTSLVLHFISRSQGELTIEKINKILNK